MAPAPWVTKPGRTPGGGGPVRAPLLKGHRVAPSTLAARARLMRAYPTPSEARLRRALRGTRLGVVFRRQVVVSGFIVDFAAPCVRLIVEVDGGYHRGREEADARRDETLHRAGYRVLRVSAEQVQRDPPAVLACIRAALGALR
jgi:very-short-patch-repair endonuclease